MDFDIETRLSDDGYTLIVEGCIRPCIAVNEYDMSGLIDYLIDTEGYSLTDARQTVKELWREIMDEFQQENEENNIGDI